MATKQPAAPKLPEGILKSDLEYPSLDYSKPISEAERHAARIAQHLQFYYTDRFGWVICVLHIRNASRAQRAIYRADSGVNDARFYAISVDKSEICTVGLGPHVKHRFELYITNARADALKRYAALAALGAERANGIRDRISTRRSRTIARRTFGAF